MDRSKEHRLGLVRGLGRAEAVAVVVGGVIGSGIFFKPPQIAAVLGSFWLIIAVWVAGGLLCLLGALCLSELASMLPHAGGLYVYIGATYGRLPAFLYGWTLFWVVRPAAIGALATAFALPLPFGETTRLAISLAVIGLLAWINVSGVVWGGRMQNATTLIKGGFLAGIAFVPLLLGQFDTGNFGSAPSQPPEGSLVTGVGIALLAVLWAYDGWHEVTPLAEEIRDPQRNVPWALVAGVGILMVLYIGANIAYHGVLSMSEVASERNVATGLMERSVGSTGGAIMTGLVMCSVFGAINTNLLHGPRVFFAMSRDRVFFSTLGRVHATRRTPARAITAQALLAGTLMILAGFIPVREIEETVVDPPAQVSIPATFGGRLSYRAPDRGRSLDSGSQAAETSAPTLAFRGVPMRWRERLELEGVSDAPGYRLALEGLYNRSNRHVFDLLTNLVVFGTGIFYVLAVSGVIVLRRREPDRPRPYRTWGYPLVPLIFLGVYAWFLTVTFLEQPVESAIGLGVVASGAPAYYLWRARL